MFSKTMIWMIAWVGIVGCDGEPQTDAETVGTIRLAAYAGDTGALVFIAQDQGLFQKHGVNIVMQEYEAGKLAADALYEGRADIATSADFVFVSGSFVRPDLRVLGTVATVNNTVEFVARKDLGIVAIRDVKGKRVGVTRKSTGEFFLGTFLTFNGLSVEDVELVDLKPSDIVTAISEGEIDAAVTWDPNVYHIKQTLGDRIISWPGQSGQAFYFVLLSTDEYVRQHPVLVQHFIKSLVDAENYIATNKADALKFVAKRFAYEASYIESTWPKHRFAVVQAQAMLLAFEDQARWRIENGLTDQKEIPNFLNYLYLDGLDAVNAAAVSIIR